MVRAGADTPINCPPCPRPSRRVALVTLGCARNEVDSEELAGRLAADGWELVADAADADVAVVNTCGFVEAAKKDSIDTLLAAADLKDGGRTQAVVAVGCLAERYGEELAEALPEADAVLGFDDYADISDAAADDPRRRHPRRRTRRATAAACCRWRRSTARLAGPRARTPGDPRPARRRRPRVRARPRVRLVRRAGGLAQAGLAAATGAARSARSRPSAARSSRAGPPTSLAEARWLAEQGVRELVLVSENSTSYGKDLGDLRLLETLLPELAAVDGHRRGSGSATCSRPRCGRAWSR